MADVDSVELFNPEQLVVLPTGFGKSLPFQLYQPVKRALVGDNSYGKVIVCCPLVSLLQDQVNKLTFLGLVTAAFRGMSNFFFSFYN